MTAIKRVEHVTNLPKEKWKKIDLPRESLKMDYYISNKARIKSKDRITGTEHLLKPTTDKKNYMRCSIKLQGKNYALYLHMQVAKYWSNKTDPSFTRYIHKDMNRKNNLPSNVIWVSDEDWKKYIKARAEKYGFVPHRKGGKAKLRAGQVAIIKKMLLSGKTRKKMIAKRFGVSHTQINRIEKGENWSSVKPAP